LEPSTVDLPLLAYDINNHQLLAQKHQENITQLMFHCYNGEEAYVELLLNSEANPNIQSSISGYSALHLVVVSSLEFNTKKHLIELLLEHGADLALQDRLEESVLHKAIRTQNVELVNYLIIKSPQLTDLIDLHDRDAFLFAVAEGASEIAEHMMQSFTQKDIKEYLKNKAFQDAFNASEKNLDVTVAERQTILSAFREKVNSFGLPTAPLQALRACSPNPSMNSLVDAASNEEAAGHLLFFIQSPTQVNVNASRPQPFSPR